MDTADPKTIEDSQPHPQGLIKVSVAFEPRDYDFVFNRAAELYGRRGLGLYIRQLVKQDREDCAVLKSFKGAE